MTIIVKPDKQGIEKAASAIKCGKVVVFPTETVYGIGADVFNEKAVKEIFKIKQRPVDNPLIVHVADIEGLEKVAKNITPKAKALIKAYWPGPLTIVFEKKKKVPRQATGGLSSVAVRMPSNPVARKLVKVAGCPIAAPSANIAGRPSCTSQKHVIDELSGKADIIIKGGNTKIGLESTVIKLGKQPYLLRPGKISLKQLKKFLPTIKAWSSSLKPLSPGMKYKHYAPRAKLILIESGLNPDHVNANIVITTKKKKYQTKTIRVKNKNEMARKIFFLLQELDKAKIPVVAVEGTDEKGIGMALMNRLRKAADNIV